ncbi:hypothetical protein YC2023_122282 [Brassica napus]
METETQKAANVNEGKERQANKKKLGKPCGAVMGGTLKKRLVQSVVSPRKKHTAKQGSKMGGEGSYEYGWWLDLCRTMPSRGLWYLKWGQVMRRVFFWNRHFAIEVIMESVEEIPFLQTDLEKFCVLIASVTSCGCNGLLGLGVYASGVLCLGMWSELYRRLHTRWVVTERSNRGSDAFTNNVIRRWVFPLRYKFIRGQEDRTSVPVVTGVCWNFRLDNINSIGFVLPQVKFMDVKLVCVMDLYRGDVLMQLISEGDGLTELNPAHIQCNYDTRVLGGDYTYVSCKIHEKVEVSHAFDMTSCDCFGYLRVESEHQKMATVQPVL